MGSLSSTRIDFASNYAQCLELIKMQTIFQLPKMWLPFRVLVISSKASYACLHQKVDESMACRHLKSPQSLPDRSLHLILVTIVSWSWITLFVQCQLTLLFLRYGSFKIWHSKSKSKAMAKVKPNDCVRYIGFNRCVFFSFCGHRSIFYKYGTFHIWPWTLKIKVMANVKSHGHI